MTELLPAIQALLEKGGKAALVAIIAIQATDLLKHVVGWGTVAFIIATVANTIVRTCG